MVVASSGFTKAGDTCNCAHASYRDELNDYFSNACKMGEQTPHLLREALSWHARFKENGSMLSTNSGVV